MMITIIGKTITGQLHTFSNVLDIHYDADRDIPCDSFSFVAVIQQEQAEFCEITAMLNGKPLFWGIVDTMEHTQSSEGRLIKISCRNIVAGLVDNEVKPNIYTRLTSSELVDRYAKPFGVLGSRFPYSASQWLMQVKKGMSYWAVIEEFCKVNYKARPYIGRDRVLTLSPVNAVVHTFSNDGGGIAYSKISVKRDYYKLISKVSIRTSADNGNNYYGYSVDNPVANRCRVRRERYLHPVGTSVSFNEQANTAVNKSLALSEARQIIDNSNKEHYSVVITLPVLLDLQVGDGAVVADQFLGNDKLFISSVALVANKNGMSTTVVLRRVI